MVFGLIFHNMKSLLKLLEGKAVGDKTCGNKGLLF